MKQEKSAAVRGATRIAAPADIFPHPRAARAGDKVIGRNVRTYRNRQELSQTALGNKLGITFQQIQKYEKGTNRICALRLLEIAIILKVTTDALFEDVVVQGKRGAARKR